MNVCILYYDNFWQQEAGFPLNQLRNLNIFAAALENRPYLCAEKQRFLPDKTIDELDIEDIDLFIIPGGDTTHLFDNGKLKDFVYKLHEKNKRIAGICGGSLLMGAYGLLDNRKCKTVSPTSRFRDIFKNAIPLNEDVVTDGNLTTAEGHAFIEFGIELGKLMNVYKSEKEALEEYKFLKNIKE